MSTEKQTVGALDGLRGFAVLLVVLSHFSLVGIHLLPPLDFSGVGKSGVYLFFVLSAFLLTRQALQQDHQVMHSIRYWLGYGLRRLLRIFPLYVLVLIIAYLLTRFTQGYGPRIETAEELVRHLLLLQGNHILWAIPVEFKYYVLLPVVTLSMYWVAKLHLWAAPILAAIALAGAAWIWPQAEAEPNSIELGPYLIIFMMGSLAAFCANNFVKHRLVSELGGWSVIIVATLTIPSVWRATVSGDIPNQYFHQHFLLFGIIWAIAVYSVIDVKTVFRTFFELSVWRSLGRISFSVYLLHFPIVQAVANHLDVHVSFQFLVALTATLLVSTVTYRYIERPPIVLGHKLTS